MGNFTISMAIFNSYFDITRGYQGYHFARFDVGDLLDDPHGTPKRCMLQGGYSIKLLVFPHSFIMYRPRYVCMYISSLDHAVN